MKISSNEIENKRKRHRQKRAYEREGEQKLIEKYVYFFNIIKN